jgi:predicted AAA+ superfamily ATPase
MDFRELSSSNPWWEDKKLIQKDKDLTRRQASNFKWTPRLLYFFKLEEDAIYTIRGPRQVGKTTFVKMMINKILDEVSAKRIFFYACDLIDSPKDLALLIEEYLNLARKSEEDRLYLFLDEISSVKEWQRGIKHLVDNGSLKNCTLILTGSHTLDIKYSAERLPGRRGNVEDVLDKVFLPMKFSEFVDIRSLEIGKKIRFLNLLRKVRREEVLSELSKARIPEELVKLNASSKELSQLFQDYLITGGIPSAIDAYLENGEIPSHIYETYISSMLGDWARWNKKQIHMTQIVQRLIQCLSSQVSWGSLCNQTDLNSHAAQEHIEILQSSFIVSPIYRIDRSKGTAYFEKERRYILMIRLFSMR